MTPPRFVGIQPRFPGFLARWRWLADPVPAERAAALRIAAAVALLLDLAFGILPYYRTLFTADGLAGRDAYPFRFRTGHFYWSVLRWLPDSWGPQAVAAVWVVAAVGLLIGYRPLLTGLICWVCAVSVWNINQWVANGGDQLRNSLLLMVALSWSGAVWGVQSVRRGAGGGPVFVPGWPLRVLLVQLCCLYVFSGVYKLLSPDWRSGYVMYYVNHDLIWSMAPRLTAWPSVTVHRLSTWVTLVWELGFPLLIAWRWTRAATLCLGVVFHLVTFLTLEIGAFGPYSLAFYAIFLPCERFGKNRTSPGILLPGGRGRGLINSHTSADRPSPQIEPGGHDVGDTDPHSPDPEP
jgi:hypothetical protein